MLRCSDCRGGQASVQRAGRSSTVSRNWTVAQIAIAERMGDQLRRSWRTNFAVATLALNPSASASAPLFRGRRQAFQTCKVKSRTMVRPASGPPCFLEWCSSARRRGASRAEKGGGQLKATRQDGLTSVLPLRCL